MSEQTIETLARRLERVERENGRLKKAGALALAVMAAVVLMGQLPQATPKVVDAEKFVLRDGSGKMRAELSMEPYGDPSLVFYDNFGTRRIYLGAIVDFPTLQLYGKTGALPNAMLGEQFLSLGGEATSVSLGVGPKASALSFYDKNRVARVDIQLTADGLPSLMLSDKEGRGGIALGAAELTMTKTGEKFQRPVSSVILIDQAGNVIWSAPPTVPASAAAPGGQSRTWILWLQTPNLVSGGFDTLALSTWPTQSQCEQERRRGLSNVRAKEFPAVLTCLPETVSPTGGR